MAKIPVGIQLYSVNGACAKDFEGTLEKLREYGFDGVEFAGYHGRTPAQISKLCADLGLVPVSSHVGFDEMASSPEKTFDTCATIGCKFIAIPYVGGEYRTGGEKRGYFIEKTAELGGIAKKFGITLLYHNHAFEFENDGEIYELDELYSKIPAELLETELDTCWVNVGGENPAEYVRKYKGRAPIVHLKDFYGRMNGRTYSLIGRDDITAPFEFRPLFEGLQDIEKIIGAAEESGTKWFIYEQDSPSMGLSSMECAKKSIENLKKIY